MWGSMNIDLCAHMMTLMPWDTFMSARRACRLWRRASETRNLNGHWLALLEARGPQRIARVGNSHRSFMWWPTTCNGPCSNKEHYMEPVIMEPVFSRDLWRPTWWGYKLAMDWMVECVRNRVRTDPKREPELRYVERYQKRLRPATDDILY